ncbi:MAG: hypothetical protein J7M34_09775 [Anaerolineae bacterium]|nr:hypothetical protein [Anaerolineae bacterium]
MTIGFDESRWEQVRENADAWWAGELKRPLVQIYVIGRDPGRPEPSIPSYEFTAFYPESTTPEQIVDRWDYDLSCMYFLGDAFPQVWLNFGPGVLAAFLGAKMVADGQTVWFQAPPGVPPIEEMDFQYDPDNPVLLRVKDLCRAAMERWEGLVQVGMTDLGGAVDVLASFYPGVQLPLALYDAPDHVKRLTWRIHELWWQAFEDIDAVLQPANPGYTCWTPIFSSEPYYMLQCDFSAMISSDMFEEFVLPELVASCRRLTNPFYHLDGPGELPHLDLLLGIPELKGIQWIPGAGAPDYIYWPDLYRRIHEAGKKIQLFGTIDVLDTVASQVGTAESMVLVGWAQPDQIQDVLDFLDKYDVR